MRIERIVRIRCQDALNDFAKTVLGKSFMGYQHFQEEAEKFYPFENKKDFLRMSTYDFLAWSLFKRLLWRKQIKLKFSYKIKMFLSQFRFKIKIKKFNFDPLLMSWFRARIKEKIKAIKEGFQKKCEICGMPVSIFRRICEDCERIESEAEASVRDHNQLTVSELIKTNKGFE